jgi:hypothetical protein
VLLLLVVTAAASLGVGAGVGETEEDGEPRPAAAAAAAAARPRALGLAWLRAGLPLSWKLTWALALGLSCVGEAPEVLALVLLLRGLMLMRLVKGAGSRRRGLPLLSSTEARWMLVVGLCVRVVVRGWGGGVNDDGRPSSNVS